MNTPTNAYITKLSSGTILALLAFSGLLVLVPFAGTVHAVQNPSSAYTINTSGVFVFPSGASLTGPVITIANAGPYALTSLTITAPSGWAFDAVSDAGDCGSSGILATVTLITASAMTCSGTALPAGQSITVTLDDLTAPSSSASSAAKVGTFTTTMIDGGSSPAAYSGPSFTFYAIASSAVIFGPVISPTLTSSNFVAGSAPLTLTASVSTGQAGVPFVFTDGGAGGTFTPSATAPVGFGGLTWVGPVFTSASGVATITYAPSNTVASGITLQASIAITTGAIFGVNTMNVIAGPPSTVTVTAGGSSTKTDYITASGTGTYSGATLSATIASGGITGALADAFGNAVSGISAQSCLLTTFGGTFDAAGTASSTNSIAAGASCSPGGAIASTNNYFQSSAYGTSTTVSVSMSGTYSGALFTATGKTQALVTSAFDSIVSAPITASVSPISAGSAAGVVSTIKLTFTLANNQAGVPFTFFGVNSTETGTTLSGSFVGGSGPSTHPAGVATNTFANIVVTSVAGSTTATATATFTIDPVFGSVVAFKLQFARPLTATPSNVVGPSSLTGTFSTGAGAASKLAVKTFFAPGPASPTTKSVAGQTDYLDVILQDFWGNSATNTGGQLQITLSVSPSTSGTLSATSVYISSSSSTTSGSFGTITFIVSATAPLGAISITATGSIYSGTGTLTVVSANPTVTVNSPSGTVGHTVYSGVPGVGFTGTAAPSLGVFPAPTIASVSYTVDGGAAVAAAGTTSWSFGATLSNGLHTIGIYSKDSAGAVSATNSTLVLVDSSVPTITVTSASSIGVGSPVTFSIVETQGDLNLASVVATTNSSATLTTTVSGTNNLGASVTYTVTVAGLPASTGHWSVTLNAKSLTGTAAVAVTAIVKVTVAFAQSVVVSGTPSYTTIGGFTGVSATYTNNWSGSQSAIVFAVWKNNLGQTVAVSTGGLTLAAGATGTAFAPLASPLPSGTYTVSVFVITTGNNPVSSTTTITVTF